MSPKGFLVLAAAAVGSIALAVVAVTGRDLPVQRLPAPEPLFPGLFDRLNDVTRVEIKTGKGPLTITQGSDGWALEQRGGYPVPAEKVRDLALGLASLEVVEAKTAKPELLPRLELRAPDAADAKSKEVRLIGKEGAVLAAAVVGKEKLGLYGGGRAGIYVRKAEDNQAWLAAGELTVPEEATGFLDEAILDVPEGDIARVVLTASAEPELRITRASREATELKLETPVPEGREVDPEKLERVASSLASLTLDDVKPAAEVAFPAGSPQARFTTWDGLEVSVAMAISGEGESAERWVRFDVAAVPPLAPPAPAKAPAEPAPAAPADPPARAAALDKKLEGWAYKLPTYLGGRFGYRIEDLLHKPDETS